MGNGQSKGIDIPLLTDEEIAQIRQEVRQKHEANVKMLVQKLGPLYVMKAQVEEEAIPKKPIKSDTLHASEMNILSSTASTGPAGSHRPAEPASDGLATHRKDGVQPLKANPSRTTTGRRSRRSTASSDDVQIISSRKIVRDGAQQPVQPNISAFRSRQDPAGKPASGQPPIQSTKLPKVTSKMPSKTSQDRQSDLPHSTITSASSSAKTLKRSRSTSMYAGLQTARKPSQQKATKTSKDTSPNVRGNDGDPVASSSTDPQNLIPPQWYTQVKSSKTRADRSEKGVLLQRLKDAVKRYNVSRSPKCLDNIRELLHKIPFVDVNDRIIRDERMLHNDDGLPKLFNSSYNGNVEFPYDIRADAEELYNKWCSRIFSTDIMRGIKLGIPKGRSENNEKTVDSIDPNWPKISARYHGNGKLQNGQWWPTQLCTLRDGAHGHSIQGINGDVGKGAYSIVIAGGLDSMGQRYANEDHGQWILYCGTDSKNGELSPDTTRMMESYENRQFVRLIRSHSLKSEYAPEVGFRYDGLYEVVWVENLDDVATNRQRRRFKMERRTEEPFRGGKGPERRPTRQEIESYYDSRMLRGISG